MEKRVPGLSIQVQIPASDEDDFRRLTLKGQFSMRAVLALMEDTFSVLRMNPEPQTRYTFPFESTAFCLPPMTESPAKPSVSTTCKKRYLRPKRKRSRTCRGN